jgi:hypothetical protein
MLKSAPPHANTDERTQAEESAMSEDWSIFEPADHDQVTRLATDLTRRASLICSDGWDQYRHLWSCGEVLGTALILRDDAELQRSCETTISALERWAFELWGITGGQSDTDAEFPRTRAWFASIRGAR